MMKNRIFRRWRSDREPRWVFAGVRARLLVWYFLLTLCIALCSVWATYKIFCSLEERSARARLENEIAAFRERLNPAGMTIDRAVDELNTFSENRSRDPNEFLLLVFDGRIYPSGNPRVPTFLTDSIERWARTDRLSATRSGYIIRVIQPVSIGGRPGAIVGIHDATTRLLAGEQMLSLIVRVTVALMVLFMAIAWLTAGRILSPLRQLTETARTITETDLSRRITVRGEDEIAEVALTFNRMLDRLQAAFTSQRDFIKDVGHELRTPITIIQGHLELMGDDPDEREATVALVRDELKRMNRLVSDLLLLARAERPNFLHPAPVDLESFTEELFAKARGLAPRDWRLEALGKGEIVCDRQKITQAILNLAQNATRHTGEEDTIAIGSAIDRDTCRFWVRDTGEGIAPSDSERIFDRFTRGANAEKRSEGFGLGLSIVRALVKAHNGRVELFSRLDEGATFTVILPKYRQEESAKRLEIETRNISRGKNDESTPNRRG